MTRINLSPVKQGSLPTVEFTWPLPDGHSPDDLTGMAITGVMEHLSTRAVTIIVGSLTVADGQTRLVAWAMAAEDTGTPGAFAFVLRASLGDELIYTLDGSLEIEANQSVTAVSGAALVGVPTADAAWLTAAAARVADGDDVATRDTDGTASNLTVLDASGNAVDAGYAASQSASANTVVRRTSDGGIAAIGQFAAGVDGRSIDNSGVYGQSTNGSGVSGYAPTTGTGVTGTSASGTGGQSTSTSGTYHHRFGTKSAIERTTGVLKFVDSTAATDRAAQRTELGLGTAALAATGDFDAAGAAAAAQAAAVQRANHTGTQLAATISDFNAAAIAAPDSISSLVTNYTVTAADAGKTLECGSAISVTLPNGLATGYRVRVRRTGSAVVSVQATGTLQELATGTGLSTVAYVEIDTEVTLVHRGSNLWLITGDYTATDVWLAGGISAANAIAAYYPLAAVDLAGSYVNLANPGTYNAAPGTAPSWSVARGWYGAANWYLTTGLSPTADGTWSALVWYENSLISSYHNLFGVYQTVGGSGAFGLQISNLNNRMATFNGSISPGYNSPLIGSAFYGFAGKSIYRNGALEPTAIPAGTGTLTQGLYIGAQNANGAPGFYAQADIKAVFIYNTTLTLAQIEAVGIAIGAIDAVTIEDVTYTSSVEA